MPYMYIFFIMMTTGSIPLLQGMEEENSTTNAAAIGIQNSIELLKSLDTQEEIPEFIESNSSSSWFSTSASSIEDVNTKEEKDVYSKEGQKINLIDLTTGYWHNQIFSKPDYSIKPTSFDEKGKQCLKRVVNAMHEAAKYKNTYTGLAAIYNEISSDEQGINTLIHNDKSLKYASAFNEFLHTETTFPELIPTFYTLKNAGFDGAEGLACDMKRTCVQALLYKEIINQSDIRVPSDRLGVLFMGKGPEVDGTILEFNKDIDIPKNKAQAQGCILLMAYYMQNKSK